MKTRQRVELEPAFLLHQRPYRESSLIADFMTADHGRIVLVARGARRPKSSLRGVLRLFQAMRISWSMKTDLGTLTLAERVTDGLVLDGETLMSAYYVNELLLRLLHRGDPQPDLFHYYSQALQDLAAGRGPSPVLRIFEKRLLDTLGYGLEFRHDVLTGESVDPDSIYEYRLEQGPVATTGTSSGDLVLPGRSLLALAEEKFPDKSTLSDARQLLKSALQLYLGERPLKTRKVMRDMRR